jgi:hypothetical protein
MMRGPARINRRFAARVITLARVSLWLATLQGFAPQPITPEVLPVAAAFALTALARVVDGAQQRGRVVVLGRADLGELGRSSRHAPDRLDRYLDMCDDLGQAPRGRSGRYLRAGIGWVGYRTLPDAAPGSRRLLDDRTS